MYNSVLKPFNYTGRSKAEIVADMECGRLLPLLVDAIHSTDCKCSRCFNTYLDKVLEESNASLS